MKELEVHIYLIYLAPMWRWLFILYIFPTVAWAQAKDICKSADADIARELLIASMETEYYQVQRYEGFTLFGRKKKEFHIKLQKGFHYRFGVAAQSEVLHYCITFHNQNCSEVKELSSNNSPNHNIIWFDYVCEESESICLEMWAPNRTLLQKTCAYLVYAKK